MGAGLPLTHFRLAEVHLRVLLHELLQHVLFLLFLTCRLPLPFHLLIIHHLLDHASRLTIQIAQFRVLRLDLCNIYLGCGCHNVCPPFGFVLLVKVDGDFFARGSRFKGPGAFVEHNRVGKFPLKRRVSACPLARVYG